MSDVISPDLGTQAWKPDDPEAPVILGHYRVMGVIGEGGMGTVYLGFHINLQRLVAIKTLRFDRADKPNLLDRFHQEMRLIGQMDHPNVVRAHDAGEKHGVFYLVMELLRGSDLGRVVQNHGPFAMAEACSLIHQSALGLAYIHKTLVHRDIKPSNLMLTTDGVLKILDLGLARFHESSIAESTPEGVVVGTYDYLSPEQAVGSKALDGRSDIYSLGCTFYKLVTGQPPFAGPGYETAASKLLAHCHEPIAELPAVRSWPPPLAAILARMTAKSPEDRFASAADLAQALAPFVGGLSSESLATSKLSDPPAAKPLSKKLPEELTSLTLATHQTTTDRIVDSKLDPRSRRRWIAAGALAVVVLIAAPFVLRPRNPEGPVDPPVVPLLNAKLDGRRDLDLLVPNQHYPLFDHEPISLTEVMSDLRTWSWYRDRQLLETRWHESLFLQFGTTSRRRYAVEVGISQAQWAGGVGVFFGYQEDAKLRAEKIPRKTYSRFQIIGIDRRERKGEVIHSVYRGRGGFYINEIGEIRLSISPFLLHEHRIPLPAAGERILSFEVVGNSLLRARFAGTDLDNLSTPVINDHFAKDPYTGGVGVFGHVHAIFGGGRFFPFME